MLTLVFSVLYWQMKFSSQFWVFFFSQYTLSSFCTKIVLTWTNKAAHFPYLPLLCKCLNNLPIKPPGLVPHREQFLVSFYNFFNLPLIFFLFFIQIWLHIFPEISFFLKILTCINLNYPHCLFLSFYIFSDKSLHS